MMEESHCPDPSNRKTRMIHLRGQSPGGRWVRWRYSDRQGGRCLAPMSSTCRTGVEAGSGREGSVMIRFESALRRSSKDHACHVTSHAFFFFSSESLVLATLSLAHDFQRRRALFFIYLLYQVSGRLLDSNTGR